MKKKKKIYIFVCQTNWYRLEHEMIKQNMVYWRVAACRHRRYRRRYTSLWPIYQKMNERDAVQAHPQTHDQTSVLWCALMTMGTNRQDISTSMRAHCDKNGCLSKNYYYCDWPNAMTDTKTVAKQRKKKIHANQDSLGFISNVDHVRARIGCRGSPGITNDGSEKSRF